MEGRDSFGVTQASRISTENGEQKSRSSSPKSLPSAFRIIASMRRSRSATRRRRLTNSWLKCAEPLQTATARRACEQGRFCMLILRRWKGTRPSVRRLRQVLRWRGNHQGWLSGELSLETLTDSYQMLNLSPELYYLQGGRRYRSSRIVVG
ncbi:hypothetical protein Taro_025347 [Colocasia esculenta]|uniref:Uncharacterized protein n=1 Tax=Colocasia esculenta TaxID=4460 RepID=A0A843VBZ8_COLES|nr:hypothetical protein [Colocasia esculenta]